MLLPRLAKPFRPLQKPPLLFAPMPKTASNTLLNRLAACLPVTVIKPKSGGGIGHIVIDPDILAVQALKTAASRKIPLLYQHFFPTGHNRDLLKTALNTDAAPKVLVTIRNIDDVALSCMEHQAATNGPWWVARGDDRFFTDAHSHFWNALLCLKFYASWAGAAQTGDWTVKFISYDDIVTAPRETLESAAAFFGLQNSLNRAAINEAATIKDNMNKGTPGRGATLGEDVKTRLRAFAATFRDIDFTPVGL